MRGNTIELNLVYGQANNAEQFLYQYDYGQRLLLTGVELPPAYEVHFGNSWTGESVTMLGDSTGVDIPDAVLLSGKPVYVWLFLHNTENDGETEYSGIIRVEKRAKPTNEEPTPVQQDTITQTIAALSNALETVQAMEEAIPQEISDAIGSEKGQPNGIATLGADGKVPSEQIPDYLNNVVEATSRSLFPRTGETGKIYIDKATNKTYRWDGNEYVEISASLALGESSSTAYRGDRGKVAYDHATAKGSAFPTGFYKITTNAQGHVTAVTPVNKSDITGLGVNGIPAGGASGQVLGKRSALDNDVQWVDQTGGGGGTGNVDDVRINGTSIVDGNGIANIPPATKNSLGAVQIGTGLSVSEDGYTSVASSPESVYKNGTASNVPVTASMQHIGAFYGLAKVAGVDMKNSGNAVGNYTDAAKTAIRSMLGTNDIIAEPYSRYYTYDYGEFTVNNGKLYRCTSAIHTAEVWTPSHWEEVTVGEALLDLINDVDGIIDDTAGPRVSNKTWSAEKISNTLSDKISRPEQDYEQGQVLGLDEYLQPVWLDVQDEISVATATETRMIIDNYQNSTTP